MVSGAEIWVVLRRVLLEEEGREGLLGDRCYDAYPMPLLQLLRIEDMESR